MNKRDILKGLKDMEKACIKIQSLVERIKIGGLYLINIYDVKRLIRVTGYGDDLVDLVMYYDLLASEEEGGSFFAWLEKIESIKKVNVEDFPLYVGWAYRSEEFYNLLKGK